MPVHALRIVAMQLERNRTTPFDQLAPVITSAKEEVESLTGKNFGPKLWGRLVTQVVSAERQIRAGGLKL